jgi:hypothetical protein
LIGAEPAPWLQPDENTVGFDPDMIHEYFLQDCNPFAHALGGHLRMFEALAGQDHHEFFASVSVVKDCLPDA